MAEVRAARFTQTLQKVSSKLADDPSMNCYTNGRFAEHHFYFVERPYVLVDERHSSFYCAAYVIPEDSPDPKQVCDHSDVPCSSLCPSWIPSDWILVYRNGEFVRQGLWEDDILKILERLEKLVDKADERKKQIEAEHKKVEREAFNAATKKARDIVKAARKKRRDGES